MIVYWWIKDASYWIHGVTYCSDVCNNAKFTGGGILKWATSWQNQQNGMCTQQRLRSAWASAQSDQSLCCPHEERLGPWLPIERTTKTLIRLGGCPGWSESSLGAQSFCWFCHEVAKVLMQQLQINAIKCTVKTLLRLGGCPGWSESLLGAQSLCWFCHVAAHFSVILAFTLLYNWVCYTSCVKLIICLAKPCIWSFPKHSVIDLDPLSETHIFSGHKKTVE